MNNKLPNNWVWTTLGEVAQYINGRAFKPSEWEEEGRPIIRIQNLTGSGNIVNRYSKPVEDKYIIQDGDFLISWSATLGAFIYHGEEAILNQHIFKVNPYINKLFLYYLVQAFIQELKNQVHGSGMQHITKGKFESTPIPLPPLPEQKRIVAKIEELFTQLDAGVVELQKAKAQLKRYRLAVLKAAVEGELTREWREAHQDELEPASKLLERILAKRRAKWEEEELAKMRAKGKEPEDNRWKRKYKEPAQPDTDGLPELPENWIWASAEQLSDETRSITYGVVKLGPHIENGIPILRTSNVRWLRLETNNIKRISPKIANKYQRTNLQGGELLISVRGTLGGIVVAPVHCKGYNISREVAMIALTDESLANVLQYFIASSVIQNWITRRTRGIAYVGINIHTLKELPVPIPPYNEQKRIVDRVSRRLSVADEIEQQIDQSLIRGERLRQSILKQAFEGKLVPQDPNDEPASVLIEEIKGEKIKTPNKVVEKQLNLFDRTSDGVDEG